MNLLQIKHNKDEALIIAELGSGEWWFTKRLCELFPQSSIHAFEINKEFIQTLEKLNYTNLKVYSESAERIWQELWTSVDLVISTLPFTIFNDELTKTIIQTSINSLKDNWLFVIIQYSDYSSDLIDSCIWSRAIYTERVMKNVPPAKIFVYKK
jgi:phospholipid N-methyltransferase